MIWMIMGQEHDWRLAKLLTATLLLLLGLIIFVELTFPDTIRMESLDPLSDSIALLRVYRVSPSVYSPLCLVYLFTFVLSVFAVPLVFSLVPRPGQRTVAVLRKLPLRKSNYFAILGFCLALIVFFYGAQFGQRNIYHTSNLLLYTVLVAFHLVVTLCFAGDMWFFIRDKKTVLLESTEHLPKSP